MPTVHMESEIGKLEERHLRESIVTAHEREEAAATGTEDEMFLVLSKADVEMDKALLQLMQVCERMYKGCDYRTMTKKYYFDRLQSRLINNNVHWIWYPHCTWSVLWTLRLKLPRIIKRRVWQKRSCRSKRYEQEKKTWFFSLYVMLKNNLYRTSL